MTTEFPDEIHPGSNEPRPIDNLLQLYIKIGGFVGVSLAVVAFLLACWISYELFHHLSGHIHIGPIIGFMFALATLIAAATIAVSVFFCASVFWAPILAGLIFLYFALHDVLLHMQHLRHH